MKNGAMLQLAGEKLAPMVETVSDSKAKEILGGDRCTTIARENDNIKVELVTVN